MSTPKTDKLLDVLGIYITGRLNNYHRAERGAWTEYDETALVRIEDQLKDSIAEAIGEKLVP